MTQFKELSVLSVRRLENAGNLKGFVDIQIGGALIVRGCTVMEGKNGVFAGMPRRLGRDGRWSDVIVPSNESLKNYYQEQILRAYSEHEPEHEPQD